MEPNCSRISGGCSSVGFLNGFSVLWFNVAILLNDKIETATCFHVHVCKLQRNISNIWNRKLSMCFQNCQLLMYCLGTVACSCFNHCIINSLTCHLKKNFLSYCLKIVWSNLTIYFSHKHLLFYETFRNWIFENSDYRSLILQLC